MTHPIAKKAALCFAVVTREEDLTDEQFAGHAERFAQYFGVDTTSVLEAFDNLTGDEYFGGAVDGPGVSGAPWA